MFWEGLLETVKKDLAWTLAQVHGQVVDKLFEKVPYWASRSERGDGHVPNSPRADYHSLMHLSQSGQTDWGRLV